MVNGRTLVGKFWGEKKEKGSRIRTDFLLKVGEMNVPVSFQSLTKWHYSDKEGIKTKMKKRRANESYKLLEVRK